MDDVVFRRARPDEADALSELALRSKAHWGYDRAFLDACRAELTFSPQGLQHRRIDADPNAESFYLAMGAERIGETASGSVAGRTLPVLRIGLAAA